MQTRIDFVPSASTTISLPQGSGTFTLSAYDAGNVDMLVQNTGTSLIAFQLGTASFIPSGTDNPSCLRLSPGRSLLLTSPATAAYAAGGDVLPTGAAAGVSTFIGATSSGPGNSVVISRGTATPRISF